MWLKGITRNYGEPGRTKKKCSCIILIDLALYNIYIIIINNVNIADINKLQDSMDVTTI